MLSTDPTRVARSGRPRDPRIDEAVLTATRALLVEVGYGDLTITAVAERAGATKPSIYRRWPTKARLVHEAAFPSEGERFVPEGDDVEADVRTMVLGAVAMFSGPVVRAALPGLLAELAADPTLHASLLERFQGGVWVRMTERLGHAVERGEVRPDIDAAALLDVLGGSVLLALLVRSDDLDDAWVDATVAIIMKGIQP